MNLFSEIYSSYYSVTSRILQAAPLTEKQMDLLIRTNAFSESALYLMPKLCKLDDGWGLLAKQDSNYHSSLKNSPVLPITMLEKSWLKSLLQDPRIRLFLEENTIAELSEKLLDIKPLYSREHFKWFDIFADGDNYSDKEYIMHFRIILSAISNRSIINIIYSSGKGRCYSGNYIPYRMEYSQKNDKFRVYVAKMKGTKTVSLVVINLARIQHVKNTEQTYQIDIDITNIFRWKRCDEPVTLEISNNRNGVERFMMEFAGYEKHTEIDEESGKCIASLWYDKQDETEILIRLLGFGPILKIIGPERFLTQVQERIDRQFKLLFPTENNED